MIYTSEQIQERFRELPIDLQKTITSIHSAEAIQTIGKNNGLLIDKMGILGYETGLALIGLTPLSDFPKVIAEKLSIPFEKAVKITEEINTEIFLKIRELMQKKQRKEDSEETSDIDVPYPISTKTAEVGGWTDTSTEKMPSRESVLAGIEDPKTLGGAPINALAKPAPTFSPTKILVPPASTAIAKIPTAPLPTTIKAPPPSNLPTRPTSILESKLQSVVKSENPVAKSHDPYREPLG